jgi:hypothetical protein
LTAEPADHAAVSEILGGIHHGRRNRSAYCNRDTNTRLEVGAKEQEQSNQLAGFITLDALQLSFLHMLLKKRTIVGKRQYQRDRHAKIAAPYTSDNDAYAVTWPLLPICINTSWLNMAKYMSTYLQPEFSSSVICNIPGKAAILLPPCSGTIIRVSGVVGAGFFD